MAQAMGPLVLIGALALTTLWASYGFRYSARPGSAAMSSPVRSEDAHGKVATIFIPALKHARVLPEAYLSGLHDVLVTSEVGRPSFLFGQLYWGGKAVYFPATALVKLTVPTIVLCLLSVGAVQFWKHHLWQCAFLLWPVAVILATSMASGLNIGFRHVFAIVPLIAIFGAAGAWSLRPSWWWARIAIVALLMWHAGSSLHAFPNYISYANELFGGPANAYKYLADSNVDWGQGEKMARDYALAKKLDNCFFIRMFTVSNRDYGIPCGGISDLEHDIPPREFTGTLIVSTNVVDGVSLYAGGRRGAQVFENHKPIAKLGGGALLVFEGTFDLTPIATEQRLQKALELWRNDQRQGMQEIQSIVAADPQSANARYFLCDAYFLMDQFQDAERECNLGLDLHYANPAADPAMAKEREAIMRANGMHIHNRHQP